jgi:DNA gyrase subunit A
VGEVLGKYHPHGDAAVYETMARMAQDFSMRCMLVEGQGNFGSVDGDPPAAMRYTEARLADPAMRMLTDIRKQTVDFGANFDGSLDEPLVLPAAIPNLLVNGATGIAVGMSTNIPPHNLGEVVDALVHMLENWTRVDDINLEDLMRFIQGPDFPTGGLIIQGAEEEDLHAAYGTGRGRITVQARAHSEKMDRGRSRIIVTELPYLTNKSSLIERIAELAREGKLDGLADLRDESDRQGLRIVIELKQTADPEVVLADLYKHTPMRSTFGIIMLALVEGEPRLLTLKQALKVYIEHRLTVIRRRAEYDLERARQRAHILEGLMIALKHLDDIIALIRRSPDAETAKARLIKTYKLSELQAQAILDMPLRRLAALERKKIEDEFKEVKAQIKELEGLLKSPLKMRQEAADELRAVKEAYGDRRRTQIVRLGAGVSATTPVLNTADLVPEKIVWIAATSEGLISRTLDDKAPRQSGTAAPMWVLQASTRDTLYLVSDRGDAAAVQVQNVPEASSADEGTPLHKVCALSDKDQLAALFTLPPQDQRPENQFILTCTRQGLLKKSAASDLPGPSAKPFTLVKVNEDDDLGWVRLTDGKAELLMSTADGMAIRFKEDEVRPMGLVAAGVGGIKLQVRDIVVGIEIIQSGSNVLFVTSDGKAKRVAMDQFPVQGRYGQGVLAWKLPRSAQLAGTATGKETSRVTLHLSKLAPKMIRMDEAPLQTRAATTGKQVVELRAGDEVIAITTGWESRAELTEKKPRTRTKPVAEQSPAVSKSKAARQTSFDELSPAPESTSPKPRGKTGKATPSKAGSQSPAKPPASKTRTRTPAVPEVATPQKSEAKATARPKTSTKPGPASVDKKSSTTQSKPTASRKPSAAKSSTKDTQSQPRTSRRKTTPPKE